ncbi:metallophosphoesterase [Legionella fallonii]|uniref:Putative Uncharacterized metallophosphoesterase HP_1044 n=1 Tax=Legionella fallonii LLAP-10 TaxID=1212491 RepID=A0A098GAM6_9GAMM|nr:metallophosphoesterase [Legionella fallonii]CEG58535.1 putative Uncharacterized metallophosphoesterase HP_1044 [Legionella fallonii LLAP-10]
MKKARFFLIVVGLLTYTYYKVNQTVPAHEWLMLLCTVLLFLVMVGWVFLYHSNPNWVELAWFRSFVWLGSFIMGLWTTFILLSIPVDVVFLVDYIVQMIFKLSAYHAETFGLIHQKINYFLLALSICLVGAGLVRALGKPGVKKIAIPLDNLPQGLNEVSIIQISDLHVGPTIRHCYVDHVVQLANAENPDFIVVTGDLADATAESIEKHLEPLSRLKARHGVYYVTGNHEYYWGIEGWIKKVKQLGFQPLINENQVIAVNGVNVLIAGVTDHIGGHFHPSHQPDLKKAMQSDEIAQFKILLAHRPDVCFEAEQLGVNLQLSGHTHAGQFFPFNVLLPLAYKYYRRFNQHGNLRLYVNPGTGYWGPANRFGVPAEITLLTLKGE